MQSLRASLLVVIGGVMVGCGSSSVGPNHTLFSPHQVRQAFQHQGIDVRRQRGSRTDDCEYTRERRADRDIPRSLYESPLETGSPNELEGRFDLASTSKHVQRAFQPHHHPRRCRQLASLDTGEDRPKQVGGGSKLGPTLEGRGWVNSGCLG
jgi:hypothetical protein